MRTKAALAAAKARGKKLGGNRGGPKVDSAKGRAARSRTADDYARQVGPIALASWQATDSYGLAAAVLRERGIRTPGGGECFIEDFRLAEPAKPGLADRARWFAQIVQAGSFASSRELNVNRL